MGLGGARPGAGHPKGKLPKTLAKIAAREHLTKLVIAQIGPMVAAQIFKAKGVPVLVSRDPLTGQIKAINSKTAAKRADLETLEVFVREPSTEAFVALIDRALGRLTAHTPEEQAPREPITVVHVFATPERAPERALNEPPMKVLESRDHWTEG